MVVETYKLIKTIKKMYPVVLFLKIGIFQMDRHIIQKKHSLSLKRVDEKLRHL